MEPACTTKQVLSVIHASGESRGGSWGARHPPPPLFLNQTEAKKYFFGDQAPAPLSKGRDERTSPPLPSPLLLFSKSGSSTTRASYFFFLWVKVIAKMQSAVHYIRAIIKWCGFSVHKKKLGSAIFRKMF